MFCYRLCVLLWMSVRRHKWAAWSLLIQIDPLDAKASRNQNSSRSGVNFECNRAKMFKKMHSILPMKPKFGEMGEKLNKGQLRAQLFQVGAKCAQSCLLAKIRGNWGEIEQRTALSATFIKWPRNAPMTSKFGEMGKSAVKQLCVGMLHTQHTLKT